MQYSVIKDATCLEDLVKRSCINPFSASVPIMEKPSSWSFLAKCVQKHLWKSDILSKDAGR